MAFLEDFGLSDFDPLRAARGIWVWNMRVDLIRLAHGLSSHR
jgi:hypothetical protein